MTTTMIPSPPADPKALIDPVDALRLLVDDLQALADRLTLAGDPPHGSPEHGKPEQKEASTRLVQSLKAARERVAGPRAVVMLLSEHASLKRHFLERLLGPFPKSPLAELITESMRGPVRLEYGPTPEHVAPSSEQDLPLIRLPALERGLAVIDTPAIETPVIEEAAAADSPSAVSLLQCAEQANAWIFVLAADHAIGKAAQMLLRQLPEQAAGLEFVVEGAEALNATARATVREQLLQTLRENCGITEPRITLIASAATEGDEGSYWHGRFATFHSVMMLRGRERWLQATRALIATAFNEVGAEIEQQLKSSAPGLRHARLRLGLKDLEGLRTRFQELGRLEGDQLREANPVSRTPASSTPDAPAPLLPSQPVATENVAQSEPPVARLIDYHDDHPDGHPDPAAEVFLSEREARELLAAQALRGPKGLRAKLTRFIQSRLTWAGTAFSAPVSPVGKGSSRPWRLLGGVWALAFVVILFWIMWPRLAAERESAAEWDLRQQSAPPPAPKPAPAPSTRTPPSLVVPAVRAETEHAGVREAVPLSSRNHAHTVIRTPLVKPVPEGLRAGVAPPRRRHGFLGIGRLWSWVRHPRSGANRNSAAPSPTNE
jgi:hypothetical protein